MNTNQKIADFLKREVRWFLIGVLAALAAVYSLHLGDLLQASEGWVFIVPLVIACGISFFERRAKQQNSSILAEK